MCTDPIGSDFFSLQIYVFQCVVVQCLVTVVRVHACSRGFRVTLRSGLPGDPAAAAASPGGPVAAAAGGGGRGASPSAHKVRL